MDSRGILVAVDGSENAIRAVAYTAEMVRNGPEFRVEVLYIERFPDRDLFASDEDWKKACLEQQQDMAHFLDDCRDILEARGMAADRIEVRTIPSCRSPFREKAPARCSTGTSIAQEILCVVKERGVGTVVVGRRGVSKAEEFLFGSVSSKIVHNAKGCTVWVVS